MASLIRNSILVKSEGIRILLKSKHSETFLNFLMNRSFETELLHYNGKSFQPSNDSVQIHLADSLCSFLPPWL